MKVSYIISSHLSYSLPRRELVASMRANGVPSERITAVVGGANDVVCENADGDAETHVVHNSYDFTGMIWLVEALRDGTASLRVRQARRFVFLHDTMLFGENSDELFDTAGDEAWATAADPAAQCNLVCYHRDYLELRADDILRLKNCDKLTAINFERHFWQSCPDDRRALYHRAECLLLGEGYPYSGARRRREYYPAVDLIKWKANWGQSMCDLVALP